MVAHSSKLKAKHQTSNIKHAIIPPMKPSAEQIRIRYLVRRKILSGEIRVSHQTAKRLVGPDTAYHLYGKHSPYEQEKGKRGKGKGEGKARRQTRRSIES